MKFIVKWKIPKGSVVDAEQRFLKTGGAPPAGVTMIGRWHGMGGGGVLIAETSDATTSASFWLTRSAATPSATWTAWTQTTAGSAAIVLPDGSVMSWMSWVSVRQE